MAFRAFLNRVAVAAGVASLAVSAAAEPPFVPVLKDNFPDPFVLLHEGRFIAYSTNDGPNVPMATSKDLANWTFVTDPATGKRRDALPRLGSWAKTGFTWAPEVLRLGNRYLLYYTASDVKRNSQCIGVAEASDPMGPFVDTRAEPIVCQTKLGGTIDANPFQDSDGKLYLYYKNDGNRVRANTWLWGQRLSDDGLSVVGEPVQMVGDRERWKDRVIEAPSMIRTPSGYSMFYSAGFFGWKPEEGGLSPYAMGYATCSTPLGPCTDAKANPILQSFKDKDAGCLSGPGHQSIFSVGSRMFVSFHGWAVTASCSKLEDERYLYVAPLHWIDGKPTFGVSLRPTTGAKPT